MGLDMYLEKKTYVKNWDHMNKENLNKITIKRDGKVREDIDTKKITYITEEIGYWRKANAIHKFFIDKCGNGEDNGSSLYVERHVIKDLLDRCKKIIKASKLVNGNIVERYKMKKEKLVSCQEPEKNIEDPSVAKELLPTQGGFFFGSLEYNQYYLSDIKNTKKICTEAIKAIDKGADIYYEASW